MTDLIMRAEQGVLGHLLTADDRQLADRLTVDDFAHPVHQAIYTAVHDAALGPGDDRLVVVAAAVEHPSVTRAFLHQVAEHAPEPARARAYAQIIVQAAFDRDSATFAAPYRAAAEHAPDPATRTSLIQLADTLTHQAEIFTPAATVDPDRTIHLRTGVTVTADTVVLHREDQIIADVLQHPDQARAVAAWLDPAVFTTEQRRLSFEMAVSLAYDHDPIDAVIVAWHVDRARDLAVYDQRPPQLPAPDPGPGSDYTYLTRLEQITVATGTAVIVGRELLAEHVQATLALSATAAAERATQTTATRQQLLQQEQPPLTAVSNIDARPIQR
jgi:replicative DNA helicase